jgi:hypothetical protein
VLTVLIDAGVYEHAFPISFFLQNRKKEIPFIDLSRTRISNVSTVVSNVSTSSTVSTVSTGQ